MEHHTQAVAHIIFECIQLKQCNLSPFSLPLHKLTSPSPPDAAALKDVEATPLLTMLAGMLLLQRAAVDTQLDRTKPPAGPVNPWPNWARTARARSKEHFIVMCFAVVAYGAACCVQRVVSRAWPLETRCDGGSADCKRTRGVRMLCVLDFFLKPLCFVPFRLLVLIDSPTTARLSLSLSTGICPDAATLKGGRVRNKYINLNWELFGQSISPTQSDDSTAAAAVV